MRTAPNPIRRYKDAHGMTYRELAKRLGISLDYAKKLGSGGLTRVSLEVAARIERKTRGEVSFAALVEWMRSRLAA